MPTCSWAYAPRFTFCSMVSPAVGSAAAPVTSRPGAGKEFP